MELYAKHYFKPIAERAHLTPPFIPALLPYDPVSKWELLICSHHILNYIMQYPTLPMALISVTHLTPPPKGHENRFSATMIFPTEYFIPYLSLTRTHAIALPRFLRRGLSEHFPDMDTTLRNWGPEKAKAFLNYIALTMPNYFTALAHHSLLSHFNASEDTTLIPVYSYLIEHQFTTPENVLAHILLSKNTPPKNPRNLLATPHRRCLQYLASQNIIFPDNVHTLISTQLDRLKVSYTQHELLGFVASLQAKSNV